MNKTTKLSKICQAFLAIGLLNFCFICLSAAAAPVNGSIDFGGPVKLNNWSLANATKVKSWRNLHVTGDSGDFANLVPSGGSVTIALPWAFKRSTPNLLTVDGFRLDLTSSSLVSEKPKFLSLEGSGT